MIYAILIITAIMATLFYFLARSADAKRDIIVFSIASAVVLVAIGLFNQARADEPELYIGAEFGVDQPYGDKPSPQCLEGYQDQWSSQGKVYAGIEYQGFYIELSPWIHKSCAAGEDDQVTDSFGFVIGGKIRFKL